MKSSCLVLIGGFFPPEVRTTLKIIAAKEGKTIKALLGEAINGVCIKYGMPPPYRV